MEVFHIRKYGRFSLSAICLFLELEAVPGADTGVLDTRDPQRFWNGDPEMRVLPPGVQRKMIREYFSPTMPRKFSFSSIMMYDGTSDPDDHIAQYKQQCVKVLAPLLSDLP